MKTVKKMNKLNEVVEVLEGLSKEFKLTDLTFIKSKVASLAVQDEYDQLGNGNIVLDFEDEYQEGKVSKQTVRIRWYNTYHDGMFLSIDWTWTTSSNHVVKIVGEQNDEGGEFILSIGNDESSSFYPNVKSVVKYGFEEHDRRSLMV